MLVCAVCEIDKKLRNRGDLASEVDFWDAYPDIMSTFLTLEDAASDSSVAAVITFMKTNNSCAGLSTLGPQTERVVDLFWFMLGTRNEKGDAVDLSILPWKPKTHEWDGEGHCVDRRRTFDPRELVSWPALGSTKII